MADPDHCRWEGSFLFLGVFSKFFRVSVQLRKMRRQWLPVDGIRFFLLRTRPDGASSIVGGRVEVYLQQILRDLIGDYL